MDRRLQYSTLALVLRNSIQVLALRCKELGCWQAAVGLSRGGLQDPRPWGCPRHSGAYSDDRLLSAQQ